MIQGPTLDQIERDNRAARHASGRLTEMERVLSLHSDQVQIDTPEAVAIADKWSKALRLHNGAPGLKPGQGLVLESLATTQAPRGAVAGLTVGGGKTLIAMLAAEALAATGQRPSSAVVLLPAPLQRQWGRMVAEWSKHYRFEAPQPVSHGALSRPSGTDLLEKLAPDLIVIDEAQAFRHSTSARTKRLIRYAVANPECRFVTMSGSLAAESIRDFATLLELALRDGSPCPLDHRELDKWCAVLDHRGEPQIADWRAVWPMVRASSRRGTDPGPLRFDSGRIRFHDRKAIAQQAFGRLLRSTRGVVLSKGGSCGASIQMQVCRPAETRPELYTPPAVVDALTELQANWALPNGELLVDALEVYRHSGTLALGYYSQQVWEVDGVTTPRDEEWLQARRGWAAAVRTVLEYHSRPGFDSPYLVEVAVKEGRGSGALASAYAWWSSVRDQAAPRAEVVWLPGAREWLAGCIRAGVADATKAPGRGHGRTLIWWQSLPVADLLADMGYQVYGAGSDQPSDDVATPACSIRVHREGANLQGSDCELGWSRNLVIEPPTSAAWGQQLIGRTHRQGQLDGIVRFWWCGMTWPLRRALEQSIAKAATIEHLSTEPQKLLLADWVG